MDWQWSYTAPFWWWGPFNGLLTILFAVAVLVLIIAVLRPRRVLPPAPVTAARSQALAILEERYARSEIEREDYLQKKKDLGG